MKRIFQLFLLAVLVLTTSTAFAQKTAVANTAWELASTWNPAGEPTSSDVVIINGFSVTINSTTAVASSVSVGNGSNNTSALTITTGNKLTVTNAFTLNCGGGNNTATLTMNGTSELSAGSLASTGNFANNIFTNGSGANGKVTLTAVAGSNLPNNTFTAFNNFEVAAGTVNAAIAIAVNGNLTIGSNAVLNMSTFGLTGVASNNIDGTLQTAAAAAAIPANKTWGGTVQYNGSTQSVINGAYTNLTLSNATTYTASGALTAQNLSTIAGGTLNMGANLLSATSITNLGTIRTANTTGSPIPALNYSGTIEYTAAGGQTIVPVTYTTLTLSNATGTQTAGGPITATTLNTTAGGTLNMVENALVVTNVSHAGTLQTQNTSSVPVSTGKTWGGTVQYNGTSGGQTIVAGTYNNLTISNASGVNTATDVSVANLSINNNANLTTTTPLSLTTLTTTSGTMLNMLENQLLVSGTVSHAGSLQTANTTNTPYSPGKTWIGSIEFNGNAGQTIPGGTYTSASINLNNSSSNTTGALSAAALSLSSTGTSLTMTGALSATSLTTVEGSTLNMATFGLTVTNVSHAGTLNTAALATAVSAGRTWGGTVNYNAATGGQSIISGTYNNLTLSNTSGTQTAGGNLVVDGTLTVNAGTLNLGTNTLTGTLATISNGGDIRTSLTAAAALASGKIWTGTVTFVPLTGNQIVANGSYQNLTMLNTSGTVSVNGPVTVTGTLTTTAGGFFNMGANDLVVNLISNSGTIQTASLSATPLTVGKTWGGTVSYNAGSGGQNVVEGNYSNLTLANTTGTQTAQADINVAGTLTTTAGGTFNMGSFALGGTLATYTNGGTIRTQNTSASPLVGGRTVGGTVVYDNLSGGQTVVAQTSYATLSMGNTSGVQTAAGSLVVGTALNTTAGGTFNMVTNTLTGAYTATGNAGTITTQALAGAFATPKTFGGTVIYNATTGSQAVITNTYNNLNLNQGITYNSGALTISAGGSLATATGSTLAMGANAINFTNTSSSITNNGTIQTGATTAAFAPAGVTFGGTGTVHYNAGASQAVINAIYNNLNLSGAARTFTAGTVAIAGIFTNGVTTSNAVGTMEFNGSSAQTIPAFSFLNLVISGGGAKTLNGAVTVTGVGSSLTLTNGVVNTSNSALLSLSQNTSLSGGSVNSYIDGPISKTGNSIFTFPVGAAGFYAPISRGGTGTGTDAFTVRYNRQQSVNTVTNPVTQVSACEFWSVARTNGSSVPVFTLTYNDNRNCSSSAYITDLTTLTVAQRAAGSWSEITGSTFVAGSTTSSGSINLGALAYSGTDFLSITLASTSILTNPLPVKFSNITARKVSNGVRIDWTIDAEENTKGYEVERSADGRNFTSIGSVAATGARAYDFTDVRPLADGYYRIRAIDHDGKYGFSNVVRMRGGESEVVIKGFFSNRNQITVQHDAAVDGTLISVVTADGQMLKNVQVVKGSQLTQIDVSSAKPGLLVVRYQSKGKVETIKMMKQ
jgi:hypothetical protein